LARRALAAGKDMRCGGGVQPLSFLCGLAATSRGSSGFPPNIEEASMPDRNRPSLKDRSADQIPNAQRGGDLSPPDPNADNGPEANATMRRVWSQPGDEASNYRNAMVGAGGKSDNHSDLVAAESAPGAVEHRSDPALPGAGKKRKA
jgi:hypothetical protein